MAQIEKGAKRYPSDLTNEEWERMAPLLRRRRRAWTKRRDRAPDDRARGDPHLDRRDLSQAQCADAHERVSRIHGERALRRCPQGGGPIQAAAEQSTPDEPTYPTGPFCPM